MYFRVMCMIVVIFLLTQTTQNFTLSTVDAQCNFMENGVISENNIDFVELLFEVNMSDIPDSGLPTFTTSLTTSPDGRWFGIRTNMGTWLIDNENGFEISSVPFTGNSNVLFPSDMIAIALDDNGQLQEWHIFEQELNEFPLFQIDGELLDSTISVQGNLIASLTLNQLDIWRSQDYSLIQSYPIDFLEESQFGTFLHFLMDGEYILVDPPGFIVYVFNTQTIEEPTQIDLGGRVIPNNYNDSVFVYNPTSENPLLWLSVDSLLDSEGVTYELIYNREITYVTAINPVSGIISSSGESGTIYLINQEGEILRTLTGHNDNVVRSIFSTTGRFLVTVDTSRENKLIIWGLPNCDN